jgi:hypothetical protein
MRMAAWHSAPSAHGKGGKGNPVVSSTTGKIIKAGSSWRDGRGAIARRENLPHRVKRALKKDNMPRRKKQTTLRLHIVRDELELFDPQPRNGFPVRNFCAETWP